MTVHSVRARRSLAEDAHRSPVISQRSYVQPPIPIASTTRATASPFSGTRLRDYDLVDLTVRFSPTSFGLGLTKPQTKLNELN